MDSKPKSSAAYKEISIEETYKLLETSVEGLSDTEVRRRLIEFGNNELVEKKQSSILEFIRRYWGPMPWLLELAMGISFALHHYFEVAIIFTLLTANAIIGQIHSGSSKRVISLLKKKLAVRSKVFRNSKWTEEDAIGIVAGDIISAKIGDIVPADTKITTGELSVDQSALTGESLPKEVHPSDIIYTGSVITRGEASGVVINTGGNTFFGKTAELVKTARPKSHQEAIMMAVVRYMIYLGIAASVVVAIFALLLHLNILDILTFVIVVLLGAIPAALPAVLTIVQSVGAKELAKKGALVTKLESVEDAASIDIICFDKTGTITQNKLSVVAAAPFFGYTEEDVFRTAALASQSEGMDMIDLAVLTYVKRKGIRLDGFKQTSYTPFDPSTKRTEALIEAEGKRFRVVKGATQVILSLCQTIPEATVLAVNKTVDGFSDKGYRTIAIAKSDGDDVAHLSFIGLLPLADPPRLDSKSMIDQARQLGIKPMLLTGDSVNIAREISGQIGIGNNILRMEDIKDLSANEKLSKINGCNGLAEIYPEDKYEIVNLLQSGGHTVGMTGDGVNDAPALKQAEMGIAVSNSTDVAKAAASIVLTDAGLGVIIDAVIISRRTYQRMLTWVINKIVKVMEFVIFLTIGFFWLHTVLLSLLGMSFLVLANDFVSMTLATDNAMSTTNPDKWNVRNIVLASFIPALLYVFGDSIILMAGIFYFHLHLHELTTLVMLSFIFNSQFRVLTVRERKHFWSSMPGRGLLISSASAILGIALIGYFGFLVPSLSLTVVLSVLAFSAFMAFCIDFPKCYLFKKYGL